MRRLGVASMRSIREQPPSVNIFTRILLEDFALKIHYSDFAKVILRHIKINFLY